MADKPKSLDPETYDPPKSRIGSAANARQFVNRLRQDDNLRSDRRTKMDGMFDGNKPWPEGVLRDLGQGHRANFNLREAEGALEAAKTPYYDLVFEVPRFANIDFYVEGAGPSVNQEFSEIISDEYHSVLDDWDGFDKNIQLHQVMMIKYGCGPMFWPHPLDWRSKAVKMGKFLVPDETEADVDEFESAVLLHHYRADQLYEYIQKEQVGKSGKWNKEAVEHAIVQAANSDFRSQLGSEHFSEIQRSLRAGDYYYAMNRSGKIHVASLFQKEFSGKITHYILTETPLDGVQEDDIENPDKEVGYLYVYKEKYGAFSEILVPFFFDVGSDGTVHTIKGQGPKIFDFCDISNKMTCQMIDGAVIGSGVTLEAQDANSLQETQIALVGGATVVQPGYKVVQTRIAESLNGALAIKRDLQNTLQSNTGNYRQRVSGENQEPTLGQAQLNAQQQAMLSKGAVNRYYNALDRWHRETLRRLLNPQLRGSVSGAEQAEYFRDCCEKRGIPKELLEMKNVKKIKAMRSVGYGSPNMRDIATQQMLQLLPMAPEQGKNFILRSRASAIPGIGQTQVDYIFPPITDNGLPEDHVAVATLENNALRQMGGQVKVADKQNHSTHFRIHFADAMGHLQQLQSGNGQNPPSAPMDALIHLEQAGPHLKQHLDRLAGDPTRKPEVKQMTDAWMTLGKATDQLSQQVDEQMQSQAENQPPPQPDPETMAAMMKVHGQLGLQKEKQDGQFALKARAQMHKERLADAKTAADIRRRNAEAMMQ